MDNQEALLEDNLLMDATRWISSSHLLFDRNIREVMTYDQHRLKGTILLRRMVYKPRPFWFEGWSSNYWKNPWWSLKLLPLLLVILEFLRYKWCFEKSSVCQEVNPPSWVEVSSFRICSNLCLEWSDWHENIQHVFNVLMACVK